MRSFVASFPRKTSRSSKEAAPEGLKKEEEAAEEDDDDEEEEARRNSQRSISAVGRSQKRGAKSETLATNPEMEHKQRGAAYQFKRN